MKLGIRPHNRQDVVVPIYVNANRWLADCPDCNGGMGADPTDDTAFCWDCGGIFRVGLPPDWRQAEEILERRPPKYRHWFPGAETVAMLEDQNRHLEMER